MTHDRTPLNSFQKFAKVTRTRKNLGPTNLVHRRIRQGSEREVNRHEHKEDLD